MPIQTQESDVSKMLKVLGVAGEGAWGGAKDYTRDLINALPIPFSLDKNYSPQYGSAEPGTSESAQLGHMAGSVAPFAAVIPESAVTGGAGLLSKLGTLLGANKGKLALAALAGGSLLKNAGDKTQAAQPAPAPSSGQPDIYSHDETPGDLPAADVAAGQPTPVVTPIPAAGTPPKAAGGVNEGMTYEQMQQALATIMGRQPANIPAPEGDLPPAKGLGGLFDRMLGLKSGPEAVAEARDPMFKQHRRSAQLANAAQEQALNEHLTPQQQTAIDFLRQHFGMSEQDILASRASDRRSEEQTREQLFADQQRQKGEQFTSGENTKQRSAIFEDKYAPALTPEALATQHPGYDPRKIQEMNQAMAFLQYMSQFDMPGQQQAGKRKVNPVPAQQ